MGALILVGTCGWSRLYEALPPSLLREEGDLGAYASLFQAVEVNSSFYRFHRPGTYLGWRRSVPEGFEFTVKCHRSITHQALLRPTEEALKGMERMLEAARTCAAPFLLQTPASLAASPEALEGTEAFFERVESGGVGLAWETRGAGSVPLDSNMPSFLL